MNVKRLHYGLLVLIALSFIGLIGGAYSINSLLSKKAAILINLKAKDQALDQQQMQLEQAKRDIKKYAGLEQIAKVVVPQDKNQAEAVRELVNIAAANGVSLGSITFPASSLGTATSGAATSTTTPATAPPKLPSPNSPVNKLSQLIPAPGLPGVYQLTISVAGDPAHLNTYGQIINFLRGLEHNRRTAQVESLNLTPTPDDPNHLTFELTLNEYIKP